MIRRQILLNGYWVPINFQTSALLTIAVPAALLHFPIRNHTQALALLASAAAAIAMLLPPLAGAISDRLRARGIKRRGAIYAGALLNAAALVWMGLAPTTPAFVAAALVGIAGQSISLAAFQALIPELVEPQNWGAASAYQGVASLVGAITGLGVASLTSPSVTFFVTAAVVIGGIATVAATPEEKLVAIDRVEVRNWYDFVVTFIARFWTIFGLTLLMTFILYFFHDVVKVGNASASTGLLAGVSLVGAILSSYFMGHLSDRTARKYIVALAGMPMAIAVIGFTLAPDPRFIMAFALLFGLGLGAFTSTGWALAIDSVPQIQNVARDLGIWGIASNLPAVVAPIFGGWLLSRYALPAQGYRALFLAAAASFVLGSIIVLAVRGRRESGNWGICFQTVALAMIAPYFALAYRIRPFGRLPFRRGATIVVTNHAHELDDTAIVTYLGLCGSWERPIYTTSSRRMFEPGFMAVRTPWVRPFLRRASMGWLFSRLGMLPIENDIFGRSIAGYAAHIQQRYGDLPLAAVFTDRALELARINPNGRRLSDIYEPRLFDLAQETRVSLNGLQEPYRHEVLEELRALVKSDLEHIENVLRSGATFYLTPEGRHTRDGRLGRMRLELKVMGPLAKVYLAAVSYDVYVGRRMNMIFRILEPEDPLDIPTSLKARRAVTVSQLLSDWLLQASGAFTFDDALAAVRARLAELPAGTFVEPDLRKDPPHLVRVALAKMTKLGTVSRANGTFELTDRRTHPDFREAADMVQYQANFFRETIEAREALEQRRVLAIV